MSTPDSVLLRFAFRRSDIRFSMLPIPAAKQGNVVDGRAFQLVQISRMGIAPIDEPGGVRA